MHVKRIIISSLLAYSLLLSSPPKVAQDAIKIVVVDGKNHYEMELHKGSTKIKASVDFENQQATVRDDTYDGLGLIVADIERKDQFFNRVKLVSLTWNSHLIVMPRTAYNQLLSVKYLYMMKDKDGAFLRIIGGDGGDSYVCDLKFDGKFLRSKKIYSLEFPDECNEITMYKYNESTR